MKRWMTVLLALGLCGLLAAAQADMQLYIAENTVSHEAGERLLTLLMETTGEPWTAVYEADGDETFGDLMLAGSAPQLAIAAPHEVMPWTREGALLALDGLAQGVEQMAIQVVDACVAEETLYAVPLLARHRRMAVNPKMFEAMSLGFLLDTRAHPVWYPSQLYQALEEFALYETPALDIWPAPEGDAAIEALLQAVSGMRLASEMTGAFTASEEELEETLDSLCALVDGGYIGTAKDRETALGRFLDGETAVFIDWTPAEDAAYAEQSGAMNLCFLPYPSTTGLPLRSYELVALCAVRSEEERENAMLLRAVEAIASLEQMGRILHSRAIWEDESEWLCDLPTLPYGPTLRSLLGGGIEAVLRGGKSPGEAAREICGAMTAIGYEQ